MKKKNLGLTGLVATNKGFEGLEGKAFYKWEDDPFVVTVIATKTPKGYLCDWWVSGLTWEGFHSKEDPGFPKLMVRAQVGVSKKENAFQLEEALHELWFDHIKELAFESAIQGGISKVEDSVSPAIKEIHAKFHLEGHDNLGHFDASISETPLTERSARQYGLLTSLGYAKSQILMAKYETEKQGVEILVGAIDRRLYMSRKSGLVEKKIKDTPFFKTGNDFHYNNN